MIHNNQSLLYVSYSWNFRHRLVRLYWYGTYHLLRKPGNSIDKSEFVNWDHPNSQVGCRLLCKIHKPVMFCFLPTLFPRRPYFFTPGTDRKIASMVPCKVPGLEDTDQYLGPIQFNMKIHWFILKHLWRKNSGVSIDIVVFQYFPIFPSVNPRFDDNSMIHHLEHVAKKLVHSCCFPQLTVWFLHKISDRVQTLRGGEIIC